jgi:hypothetical protein
LTLNPVAPLLAAGVRITVVTRFDGNEAPSIVKSARGVPVFTPTSNIRTRVRLSAYDTKVPPVAELLLKPEI